MIAGKENDQDRVVRKIRERVSLAVGRRQSKIRRALADWQSEAHWYSCTGPRRCANLS
jgi:hypothetical protein